MSTIYKPTKRLIHINDPFFQDGNILLRGFWLRKEAQTNNEIQLILQETQSALSKQIPIRCEPCRIQLPNTMAYEEHYEAKHTHVCLTCNKVFPGSLWLKLHIDEIHNTIFLIRKERGEKIHACYVESCSKFFSTPKMRRLHLIHKHKYPTHFPFDLVFTGTLSFQQLKKRDQNNKRRLKKLKGDIDMDRLHISKKNNVKDIEMDLSHHSEESITKEVGMNRNRYKEGNIVNMDQPRDPEESKTQEVEMSELTDAFERKLKIPKSISFGKHVNRSLLLSSKEKKKKPQQ